ncbi:hypothetical protein ABEG63_11285 [Chryseobacterium sp. C39-AII1]|uniref:hypothetical protein n=1 Tax=Chryseobacterium sp. C39-AII1 TaxID=3080332 RepID=UPI003209D1E4
MFNKFFKNKTRIIEITDPDRIYIENIRSFFNISSRFAKFLCETAVRQGLFEKKIAIECTNEDCKRIIKVFDTSEELPDELTCIVCEAEGKEIYTYQKDNYKIIEFYKLVKDEHR